MKKRFSTILMTMILGIVSLSGLEMEFNSSYDYFRSIPDGSWNGNQGVVFGANAGFDLFDCFFGQLGGSIGLYNWDGRQNQRFRNPKAWQQQSFLTAGFFSYYGQWNFGIVYDRQFVKHFSIYDVSCSFDQLRFQGGYQFCQDEFGLWGTAYLHKARKHIDGLPVSFRAISQLSGFWTHYFCNCAKTTLWLGAPYQDSLRFSHRRPGLFVVGFAVRAPLTDQLFLEGHGSYMRARTESGFHQSRNYAANINIGITYYFGECCCYGATYMPLANNSNFLVDATTNQ